MKTSIFTEDCVLFSDEALSYVNCEVNRQNVRYWSEQNPHFIDYSKQQGAQKIMIWCGLWKTRAWAILFRGSREW